MDAIGKATRMRAAWLQRLASTVHAASSFSGAAVDSQLKLLPAAAAADQSSPAHNDIVISGAQRHLAAAATRIQARQRGNAARGALSARLGAEHGRMATRVQARWRGNRVRRLVFARLGVGSLAAAAHDRAWRCRTEMHVTALNAMREARVQCDCAAVLACMDSLPGSVPVQARGCADIARLAPMERARSGALPLQIRAAVVRVSAAMRRHQYVGDVQRHGCAALLALCRGRPFRRRALVQGRGLAAAIAALRGHAHGTAQWRHTALHAARLLSALCPCQAQAVLECGGVRLLVELREPGC